MKKVISLVGVLSVVFSFNIQAKTEQWTFAAGDDRSKAFVSANIIDIEGGLKVINFLRNYSETIDLGIDPVTGTTWYPHKSVEIKYEVRCETKKLAMRSWTMFESTGGSGGVVWADRNHGNPYFQTATSDEEIAVVGAACGETVALGSSDSKDKSL